MRRLLLVVCWLAAAQTVCARKPAVRFDLPYTLERGKYVVTVETAAGPRRFAFDTGASQTCISERLSRELGLAASGRGRRAISKAIVMRSPMSGCRISGWARRPTPTGR
ncbi:MAG: hypothetical protein ACLRM8_07485 [Alistipes sp.]